MTNELVLTSGQQNALEKFGRFLVDPIETVFLLGGYSGTGKTTLVKHLLGQLEDFMQTVRLIDPSAPDYIVALTATTNKAAEAFAQLSGQAVTTIHSFLGLRVQTDYSTGKSSLVSKHHERKRGYLLFIDEASYVDSDLLSLIFQLTEKCKIVFMGDPAQLTPVMASNTPVFSSHFQGAHLDQVVRQAENNPIVDLSTRFRNTVNTGEFFNFIPDGKAIKHLSREAFNMAIQDEFIRPDWRYQDSKILAWTNKCTIDYNHAVRDHVKGDPNFQVGDYAVVNKFVTDMGGVSFKTDQLVLITEISEETQQYGVKGHFFTLDGRSSLFCPSSLAEKNALIKHSRVNNAVSTLANIETRWVDLRAAFACTINKAQGSTFDRVFIDLDDIRRCNSGDQIARMLYVGVSRARHQVFFTGDIA